MPINRLSITLSKYNNNYSKWQTILYYFSLKRYHSMLSFVNLPTLEKKIPCFQYWVTKSFSSSSKAEKVIHLLLINWYISFLWWSYFPHVIKKMIFIIYILLELHILHNRSFLEMLVNLPTSIFNLKGNS